MTAELYEVKTHRCICSDKQACSQLALQSSTAVEGMHRVLGMGPVLHCWVTAELHEVQKVIGVDAVTSKPVLSLPCRAALL